MNIKNSVGKVIGIGAAIAGVVLLKLLSDNKNTKYSNKWFESVCDDELETEREKVRQEYCSTGDNYSLAIELQQLLWKFDDAMRQRTWHDGDAYEYPKHREHGWYLPSDDE